MEKAFLTGLQFRSTYFKKSLFRGKTLALCVLAIKAFYTLENLDVCV